MGSKIFVDYSLNKKANSIFDKDLYFGQNTKGIFLRVKDEAALSEINRIGKLLFYDPVLSGNNMRSCASCHKSSEYFTDTVATRAFQLNHRDLLTRNSPTLINAGFNYLIMLDGKHISLQGQVKDVITNSKELGSNEREVMKKLLSCPDYKRAFENLLQYTPQEPEITFDHIASAITFYYELRFQYAAHGDELKETNINHNELEWIVLFLRYKKKTNYNINNYLKR